MKLHKAKNRCLRCGSEMTCKKDVINTKKFCSTRCHFSYRKEQGLYKKENNSFWGKKHTKESLKKMSDFMKGKAAWNKGKYGTKLSPEHIAKIKESLSNEKCYTWKGGCDSWWQKRIKERDNYTCVDCGLKERGIINAHHIKSRSKFPELRYNLDNGVSLCPNCHARRHLKKGG
jgi:hypothetical protein